MNNNSWERAQTADITGESLGKDANTRNIKTVGASMSHIRPYTPALTSQKPIERKETEKIIVD